MLAGARLLPVLRYLREHPRLVPLDDQMTLGEVLRTWTLRMHERAFPGHPYVWDEFADYVGVMPVALLLAGIAVAAVFRRDGETRQRRIDLVLLAGLVWCALGNIPGASAFGLLHELPIYTSLRVPSRFLGPAMVGFALVVTSALMAARARVVELRPSGVQRAFGVRARSCWWSRSPSMWSVTTQVRAATGDGPSAAARRAPRPTSTRRAPTTDASRPTRCAASARGSATCRSSGGRRPASSTAR